MNECFKKYFSVKALLYFCFFLLLFCFFSYRLIRVPPGINIDESSIGYNASLISKNLRDENGRLLPVFILTLEGKDWKQPVRIYLTAFLFKLFGVSYLNLRLVSVFFAVFSCYIFLRILRLFFSEKIGFAGLLLFVSSPSLLLQSHLALENIDAMFFTLLWLYFLLLYSIQNNKLELFISAVFLGISFYSYKGMRAFVPIYIISSIIFVIWKVFREKKKKYFDIGFFILGLIPFLAPIKYFQLHYFGAIFDPATVNTPSFYDAVNTFLSSFDFSFLFLKGDKMIIHSTGHHGIFLIFTVLLFFCGFLQLAKEKNRTFYFIFFTLIVTPILLTSVGSVYRASRLMVYIPFFTFIFTLGIKDLSEIKNIKFKLLVSVFFVIVLTANYFDFVTYYWYIYPKTLSSNFSPNIDSAMKNLRDLSLNKEKTAYIEYSLFNDHKADFQFFGEVYFSKAKALVWTREIEEFPNRGIVLTAISGSNDIFNLKKIDSLESGQKTLFIVEK